MRKRADADNAAVTSVPADGAAETVSEPEEALLTCDTPAGAGDTVGDTDTATATPFSLRETVAGAGETEGALVSAATLLAMATTTTIRIDNMLVNFMVRLYP